MRLDIATRRRRAEPRRIGIGLYALRTVSGDAAPVCATREESDHGADTASTGVPTVLGTDAIVEALTRAAQTARVRIEVDAAWVRLFVLPWTPALSTARRWEQFAASRLAQRYDCASEDWIIRVLPAQPPHARLVVALPRVLVDACVRACGKRLAGLEVGVLNWLQTAAAAQRGWSGCQVELDDLQAWIFVFRRGALMRARARRERTAEALAAAIEAEWAASALPAEGSAPQACTVHWGPRALAAGLDRAFGLQVRASSLPARFDQATAAVPA